MHEIKDSAEHMELTTAEQAAKPDHIAAYILAKVAVSNRQTLRLVIHSIFEEGIDKSPWASMCARLCKLIAESISPHLRDESVLNRKGEVLAGRQLVRKHLLDRFQEQFERRWVKDSAHRPGDGQTEDETQEDALLSSAYCVAALAKQRDLNLVKFLAEIHRVKMCTDTIIYMCVGQLIKYVEIPDEAGIEPLTLLLKTVGGRLDSSVIGRNQMKFYIARIRKVIDDPEYPSNLKFMLIDLVDLWKRGWRPRRVTWASK